MTGEDAKAPGLEGTPVFCVVRVAGAWVEEGGGEERGVMGLACGACGGGTTWACARSEVAATEGSEQRECLTEVVTGSVRETRLSIQAGFGMILSVYIYIYVFSFT